MDFQTGVIINLNKNGYGFIKPDDKNKIKNVFFYCSDLVEARFEDLKLGQVVAYGLEEDSKGRDRAVKINLLLLNNKQNI